jgi:hypothetical protein
MPSTHLSTFSVANPNFFGVDFTKINVEVGLLLFFMSIFYINTLKAFLPNSKHASGRRHLEQYRFPVTFPNEFYFPFHLELQLLRTSSKRYFQWFSYQVRGDGRSKVKSYHWLHDQCECINILIIESWGSQRLFDLSSWVFVSLWSPYLLWYRISSVSLVQSPLRISLCAYLSVRWLYCISHRFF